MFLYLCFCAERPSWLSAYVCACLCECYASHVSLVLKCGAHSVWLNNEFSRLRTEELTLLITQINKHADEQQQWNNGNTTGSVSSLANRKDNYSYPPTPSLLFKHPLHHLSFSSHTSLCVLSLLFSPYHCSLMHVCSFSFLFRWFLSFPVFLPPSFFLWHYSTSYFL